MYLVKIHAFENGIIFKLNTHKKAIVVIVIVKAIVKTLSISGLIFDHFWQLDVPMTQMGGRITRPVTDEKKM